MSVVCLQTVLDSNGTERDFLKVIYDYIMGLWDGITCSVTPEDGSTITDADYDDFVWVDDKKCDMDFALDSTAVLTFRSYPDMDAYGSRGYSVYFSVNGEPPIASISAGKTNQKGTFSFYGNHGHITAGKLPTATAYRRYVFNKYISDNVDILWMAQNDANTYKEAAISIMRFKDTSGNVYWAGSNNLALDDKKGAEIVDNGIVCKSDGTNSYVKTDMFKFASKPGYLDFISHTNYASGGIKAFSCGDIYDCTTVKLGDTLSVKDGANFLAIGSHSMVKL